MSTAKAKAKPKAQPKWFAEPVHAGMDDCTWALGERNVGACAYVWRGELDNGPLALLVVKMLNEHEKKKGNK